MPDLMQMCYRILTGSGLLLRVSTLYITHKQVCSEAVRIVFFPRTNYRSMIL